MEEREQEEEPLSREVHKLNEVTTLWIMQAPYNPINGPDYVEYISYAVVVSTRHSFSSRYGLGGGGGEGKKL